MVVPIRSLQAFEDVILCGYGEIKVGGSDIVLSKLQLQFIWDSRKDKGRHAHFRGKSKTSVGLLAR